MNNSIDSHNLVKTDEMIEILTTIVRSAVNNPEDAKVLPAVLLKGPPGCGKSTIVRQIATDLKIGFIDVRLAQMERVDLCGLPSVKDGVTTWNVPDFWPRDPNSKGIIFFDEITAASSDVQVASYSLILDRKIPNSGYELPSGWCIIAAGNRKEDKAVAKTMSSALANRFMHFDLEADPEDWTDWAVTHDIHPSVTGYVRWRPQNLFRMGDQNLEGGWPSPRSWERVSGIIPRFSYNEELCRKSVYALIGPVVGLEFCEFYKINAKMDDVKKMLTDPNAPIIIPEKSDQKYALCAAISYLLWNGKDEKEHTLRISGMYRILMNMSADFATMCVKLCCCGNSKISRFQASAMIMNNPGYAAFAEKFGSAWTKKYTLDK